MLCPLCHTQNRENARFCKGCGQVLTPVTASAQSAENVPVPDSVQPATTTTAQSGVSEVPQETGTQSTVDAANTHEQLTADVQPPAPSDTSDIHTDTHTQTDANPEPTETAPASLAGDETIDEEASSETVSEHDISLDPTQILTPEYMHDYYARRQQREVPLSRVNGAVPTASAAVDVSTPASDIAPDNTEQERRAAIADTPTIITQPRQAPALESESAAQEDATDEVKETSTKEAAAKEAPATDAPAETGLDASGKASGEELSKEPSAEQSKEASVEQSKEPSDKSPAEPSAPAGQDREQELQQTTTEPIAEPQQAIDSTEEEALEPEDEAGKRPASSEQTEQAGENEQPVATTPSPAPDDETAQGDVSSFPLLAAGTLVGDRYEVKQVLSSDEHEHVYEVTDRKGYLHCWNCGSEQNADGDEFCIDCGAELSNAAYYLREYPQSAPSDNDAQVLQGNIVNTFVSQGYTYVVEQPQESQNTFPTGVRLVVATDSDAGTVRRADVNEDSTLAMLMERVHESISVPVGLFVVADGMGGHANGQGASRATIALIAEHVMRNLFLPPFDVEKSGQPAQAWEDEQIKEILRQAIEEANSALCQMNQEEKSDAGSTLTGFMMIGDRAFIFNVGDSRTYMLRDTKLYQLTNDHSLVGQLVAGGLIEPEDVYTHPQRNQIFRSIGDKQNVQVDLFTQQVHPGDILLSCSDGLWEMVRDPQIAETLNQAPDPQSACARLIEEANVNGGEDNISAVIVFVR